MRPKLFRLSDLPWASIPAAIVALCIAAAAWTLAAGEEVAVGGWVTLAAAVAMAVTIVVVFYVKRWLWLRKWIYSAVYSTGTVDYFAEPGANRFTMVAAMADIELMARRWVDYIPTAKPFDAIGGVAVLLRPGKYWEHTGAGWWKRRVAGLAQGKFLQVATDYPSIAQTAHKHELSHVVINAQLGRQVGEVEAHELFKLVGV